MMRGVIDAFETVLVLAPAHRRRGLRLRRHRRAAARARRRRPPDRVLDRVAVAARRALHPTRSRTRCARPRTSSASHADALTVHDFEVRTFPAVRQEILEVLIDAARDLRARRRAAADGRATSTRITPRSPPRACARSSAPRCWATRSRGTSSGSRSRPTSCSKSATSTRRCARLQCYRSAGASQLRQRGVHPQPRAHPRDRDRPRVRGMLRGRAVGRMSARVLLTAVGSPGRGASDRGPAAATASARCRSSAPT